MAKYKSCNYSQTMMVPISLEDQLTEGTIEFAINMLVEERMDMTRFDGKFKNEDRRNEVRRLSDKYIKENGGWDSMIRY